MISASCTTTDAQWPPGPSGETMAEFAAFMADPLGKQIEYWHEYGDVFSVPFPTGPVVFVASPELAGQLVVNHLDRGDLTRRTAPAQGMGITLLTGDEWRRMRLIMQPLFSRQVLRSMAGLMVEAVAERLDQLDRHAESGEVFDMSKVLGGVTIRVLFHSMFSDEFSDDEIDFAVEQLNIISVYKGELMMQGMAPPGTPMRTEEAGKKAVAALDRLLYRAIRRRRAAPSPNDLLGRLIAATDDDGAHLTDDEIRDELTVLFFGGYETTQWAMAWALGLLPAEPEALAKATAEVDALSGRTPTADDLRSLQYLRACIDEALRIQASLMLPRQLSHDDTFGGYTLPEGTLVAASLAVIHQRNDLWGEVDRFVPDRFLDHSPEEHHKYQMLSFGGGPRLCLGINLAYFEAQFTMAMFLQRYRYELVEGWMPTPKHQYSIVLEGGLPITITRRDEVPA